MPKQLIIVFYERHQQPLRIVKIGPASNIKSTGMNCQGQTSIHHQSCAVDVAA